MWWCSKWFSLEPKLHISCCFFVGSSKVDHGMRGHAVFCILPFQRRLATICCKLLQSGTTTLFIHSTPWCIGYQTKNMYTISAVSASIGETSWPIFGAVAGVLFVSLEVVVRKKHEILEKPNQQASMTMTQKLTICKEKREQNKKQKTEDLRVVEWQTNNNHMHVQSPSTNMYSYGIDWLLLP